jgi:hypothetical protein
MRLMTVSERLSRLSCFNHKIKTLRLGLGRQQYIGRDANNRLSAGRLGVGGFLKRAEGEPGDKNAG